MRARGKQETLNRHQLDKGSGSKGHEHKDFANTKDVAALEKKDNNERALKERTTIEFFERGLNRFL